MSFLSHRVPRLVEAEGNLEFSSPKLYRAAPWGSCLGLYPGPWSSQDRDAKPRVISVGGHLEGGGVGGRWKHLGWMRDMLAREATSALSLSHLPTAARLPSRVGGDGRCGSSGGEGKTRCGAATKCRGGLRKKLRFCFFFLFLFPSQT